MKKLVTLLLAVILSGCAAMQDSLEAPYVTLTDLRMLDMTLFEQRYGLKIRVQNPNPVELPITGMNFQLDINDTELGRGVSDQAVTVPAYGEAVVEIKLTSNLIRIFDQIRGLESGKGQSLRYHLSGGLSLANRMSKVPFDYQGEIGQRR
ncbi:MAG TPA: LEA type 2 family protein [Sulfuricaulis sp.]|nr:LEA type 2 family protein [Sulfuricaulis sp.]